MLLFRTVKEYCTIDMLFEFQSLAWKIKYLQVNYINVL